jgi:hypothetical protein
MMFPVNISKEKMEILSRTFQCQSGQMPVIKLGLTKPSVQELQPIAQRMKKGPVQRAQFLRLVTVIGYLHVNLDHVTSVFSLALDH